MNDETQTAGELVGEAPKKTRAIAADNPYTASILVRVEPSMVDEIKAYKDRVNGSRSGPRWNNTDVAREFLKRGLMQDWILSDTPLASQRSANEPPQDRHVTINDVEDVLRRIQREGRADDLREAASLCERWAALFRAMAPEPTPVAVTASSQPEATPAPIVTHPAVVEPYAKAPVPAPKAHPSKWNQHTEAALRKRAKAARVTGQAIADAIGRAQTTGNAWLRGDTNWDLSAPKQLDLIERLVQKAEGK